MSEEIKPASEEAAAGKSAEELVNLKTEMARKFDNNKLELDALKQQNTQVLAALDALAQSSAPKKTPSDDDDEDLRYNNPVEYERRLEEKISNKVSQRVDAETAVNQTYQNTVSELVGQFPELNVADSDMYKATMKILDTYPKSQRMDPATMRAASYQAAANIELVPRPKRKAASDDDSFSLSAAPPGSRKSKSAPMAGSDVIAIAGLFGLDTSDKKVLENLEKHTKRDTYARWR